MTPRQTLTALFAATFLLFLAAPPLSAQGDSVQTFLPTVEKTARITNDFELLDLICTGDTCIVEVVSTSASAANLNNLIDECEYRVETDPLEPMIFEVPLDFITEVTPFGDVRIAGDLSVEVASEVYTLVEADVRFLRGNASLGQFEFASGKVQFPLDLFESGGFGRPNDEIVSIIGIDRGDNLDELGVLLCPMLKYLYFQIEGTRTVSGALSDNTGFSYEMTAGSTLVVDPRDASLQLGLEIPVVGRGSLGLSQQGLLPFVPKNVWGIEEHAVPFTGHVYNRVQDVEVQAKFGIPLVIDNGVLVIDGDPDGTTPVFAWLELVSLHLNPTRPSLVDFDDLIGGRTSDRAWGFNGEISLALPVLGDIDLEVFGEELFDFKLGEASLYTLFSEADSRTYFSGFAQGNSQSPAQAFNAAVGTRIAGHFSDALTDFEFTQDGHFDLVPNAIFDVVGLDLMPLTVQGVAHADINGIQFNGTTTSELLSSVVFDGAATVDFDLSFENVLLSSLGVAGKVSIPAAGITGTGELTIAPDGARVLGAFDLNPVLFADLTGVEMNLISFDGEVGIGANGFSINGTTSSQIHPQIALANAEIDGVIDTVNPEDSFLKITGKITAAGVSLGASASMMINQSGISIEGVYDNSINNVKLGGSLTTAGLNLSGSTSLTLPLETPAVRGKLFLGVCRPALPGESTNCVLVPAVDLGEFRTSISLSLVNIGLSGSANGQYCTANNACQSIGVALELSSTPKACATIPVINEEVCINI